MEKEKTLYISDLDGTLLKNDALLSEYTTDTLNALIAEGLDFTIATGRTLTSSEKVLSGLALRLPIVLMNGVLIYDLNSRRYLKINALPRETADEVVSILRRYGVTGFMYELTDDMLMPYYETLNEPHLRDFMDERIAKYGKPFYFTKDFGKIVSDNIIYFALLERRELLLPVCEALCDVPKLKFVFYEDTYRVGYWFLEIFSEHASKQSAVSFLKDTFGFRRAVGFGDNLNDLPMFDACDLKIAVENAKQEVRRAADFICGTNDGDGVARWIYDYTYRHDFKESGRAKDGENS